ncbi:MAG: metalloregulator ArsR/SmtB family transcription factor [Pseudomonadota bacterium]
MDTKHVEERLEDAVTLLKAMSNKRRMMILCALCQQERSVGDLEKMVGLSQSALSQHLARLRRDGFVKTRREAQTIYYSTDSPQVCAVMDALNGIFMDGEPCAFKDQPND